MKTFLGGMLDYWVIEIKLKDIDASQNEPLIFH
jgi:hypothetical protein